MSRFDFTQRHSVKREELRAAAPQDVRTSLVDFCERIEGRADVDFDDAMRVGILLQTNPSGCDELLVEWLLAQPSPLRVDLVGALLQGFWLPGSAAPPLRSDLVMKLIVGRSAVRLSPDADYTYSLLMGGVIDNPHASAGLREQAMKEIEKIAIMGTGDGSLDSSLLSLRSRHRQNLGSSGEARTGMYRAYSSAGDTDAPFVVEEAVSQREIAHVLSVSQQEQTLIVEYRKLVPELSNILVLDAIAESCLCELLAHEYRSRVSEVEYVDKASQFKGTLPYL